MVDDYIDAERRTVIFNLNQRLTRQFRLNNRLMGHVIVDNGSAASTHHRRAGVVGHIVRGVVGRVVGRVIDGRKPDDVGIVVSLIEF